jgi:hypothetical protein
MQNLFGSFESISKRRFAFLEQRFGFQTRKHVQDNFGCFVLYQNATTGVRISFGRDGMIYVTLYKLQDGELPKYPVFFSPRADFLVFDLNDLLAVRGQQPIHQNPRTIAADANFEKTLTTFAEQLATHASDVLRGDFGVLPEIQKVVARRAAR